jgi:acetyltransferase-like isoleucine patch superfamily enzyme
MSDMSMLKQVLIAVVRSVSFLRPIYETARTACPVNHKYFFFQKVLGFNRRVPWPVHFTSVVTGHEFISIGINTAPGASQGNYIFAKEDSPIVVGDFTTVASNVCLGAFNHDVYDISQYVSKGGIHIGRYCWIGANAVVLSGVRLGDHTVVAAGAVVTRSCEEGYAVLAGNPARVVKRLDKERVVAFDHPWHYHGYRKVR